MSGYGEPRGSSLSACLGANIASEPSNHSLTTATGSKRSSADSDLLLCHVGLRRTSRFRFGCGTGCEHSEMRGYFDSPVSAHIRFTPAHLIMRACRQCVHESARLFRALCSHAWYGGDCGEWQNRRFYHLLFAAHTCHAWLARLTRARRGGLQGGRRESSLLTFAALFVSEKREKGKVTL